MGQGIFLHPYYSGVGSSNTTTNSLPTQTVSDDVKKTDKFKHSCLDALESIGISQLAENVHFRDFYKMEQGRLVHSDYGIEDAQILNRIRDLGDSVGIPTFVKHYDFIGIITRKLIGEWLNTKDNFKVDAIDEISESDFLRERTRRVSEYATESFKKELELELLRMGVNPTDKEFSSEEEQQQYMQMVEQEKAKLLPPEIIEKELSKNFKTKAAEWAEHVMEADQKRFYLDNLDEKEMRDFLLTGRFFRNYYVGYDYYKPERWKPIETFFSKDVDIEYPQDGEYVGRVFYISPSNIMARYGHLLKPKDIKKLQQRFGDTSGNAPLNSRAHALRGHMTEGLFGQTQTIPFHNYYDHDLGLQIQDALDVPMGETILDTPEGQQRIPSWLTPFQNENYLGYSYSQVQRDDINVRTDLMQVTEAYWRSWKKMWFLNYTASSGQAVTEIITDEILKEFVKENNIKRISTKSLVDLQKEPLEENTMYEFWIPEVWKGIKINSGNSFLGDNLYLSVEPLPYQIKGDSNILDVKLPVAGIISDGMAQRLRPFQVGYNICLNQIFNLLEKEIGMFFLFDINFLPSEYKDQGDIEESLLKLRDLAKDIGLVPLDTTKQNMQGANPQMNTFMVQDVSFDKQINSRIQLSNYYYQKALEQIGITPQRLGQATTYETATGIQQGVEASYDSTADIFNAMSTARKKAMELHLAVAQYCQKEHLDVDFVFTGSDGDKHYLNLTDPDFPLRRLGLIPINDPRQRRDLESLRNTLLQTNTLGADMLSYAELFTADTMVELVAIGRKGRDEKQKEVEAQRAHEQELLNKQLQAQANEKEANREFEAKENEKDNETKIYVAELTAQGRLGDNDSNMAYLDYVAKTSQESINNLNSERELQIKEKLTDSKIEAEKYKVSKIAEDLKNKTKDLELKERKMSNDKYIALINKN